MEIITIKPHKRTILTRDHGTKFISLPETNFVKFYFGRYAFGKIYGNYLCPSNLHYSAMIDCGSWINSIRDNFTNKELLNLFWQSSFIFNYDNFDLLPNLGLIDIKDNKVHSIASFNNYNDDLKESFRLAIRDVKCNYTRISSYMFLDDPEMLLKEIALLTTGGKYENDRFNKLFSLFAFVFNYMINNKNFINKNLNEYIIFEIIKELIEKTFSFDFDRQVDMLNAFSCLKNISLNINNLINKLRVDFEKNEVVISNLNKSKCYLDNFIIDFSSKYKEAINKDNRFKYYYLDENGEAQFSYEPQNISPENKLRIVNQTRFQRGDYNIFVSTVFIFVDHNHFDEGEPLLFETMVFINEQSDCFCKRFSTRKQAADFHEKFINDEDLINTAIHNYHEYGDGENKLK